MNDDWLRADLELAVEAARGAGEILHRAFGTGLDVDYKSEDQPVTEADREADRFLRGVLVAARPSYGCVSEEGSDTSPGADRIWVVDPLDGTWNFIERRPEFAVSIGLVERGTPVLGVVYNPESGALYTAARGKGARLNGQPIHSETFRRESPRLVASISELDRGHLAPLKAFFEVETLGSTVLKAARVAEGGADVYLSRTRKRSWDVCAACLIAHEADAHVTDGRGLPLLFEDLTAEIDGLLVLGSGGETEIGRVLDLVGRSEVLPNQEGRG